MKFYNSLWFWLIVFPFTFGMTLMASTGKEQFLLAGGGFGTLMGVGLAIGWCLRQVG